MLRTLLLLSMLVAASAADADDDPLARAQALIEAGKPAEAYALLEPLEASYAGEPAFDYLYGVAALDSGQALRAVFALERVVDTKPDHGPARAELARAYLALGETDDARAEFEKVQEMDLPPEARQTIDRYMTGIELFHDRTRTRFRPWVLVGLGYDTNVNGATDAKSVIVPNISATQPALLGGTENSPLWTLGAGTRFTTPLDVERGLSLFGRIGLDHRLTVDEADFSTSAAAGALGINLRRDRHQFRLAAEADIVKIDGIGRVSGDRETAGISTQYQYAPTDRDQMTAFAQFALVRYPDQRVRDVNRFTGGLGWGHAFADIAGTPILYGSVFGGFDDEQSEASGGHFGRDFYGARVGASYQPRERHQVYTTLTWQQSDYSERDPFFAKRRDDEFFDIEAGYRFQYDENWSLSPTLRYSDNSSNIVINEYDRFEVLLTLRNDF